MNTFYIHASVRIFTLIKRQGRHVDYDGNINNLEQTIHNRFSTKLNKITWYYEHHSQYMLNQ